MLVAGSREKKASTVRVKPTALGVLAVNHVNIWSWLTFPPKDLKRCAGFFPWIPCILSLSDGCHTHPAPCVSNPTDHWKTPEDFCCCCFVFIYAVSNYSGQILLVVAHTTLLVGLLEPEWKLKLKDDFKIIFHHCTEICHKSDSHRKPTALELTWWGDAGEHNLRIWTELNTKLSFNTCIFP